MRANKIYRQSHLYTWLAHTLFGLFSSEIQVDTTLATAHCFSLISFRLKSNKATKVDPIVPTDSKQFQKSHFRSTETKKCLIDMAPVHASTSTTRIPTTIRHTIDKGLRTFSWRPNERIITCSAPRNDSARWTCTSPHR